MRPIVVGHRDFGDGRPRNCTSVPWGDVVTAYKSTWSTWPFRNEPHEYYGSLGIANSKALSAL